MVVLQLAIGIEGRVPRILRAAAIDPHAPEGFKDEAERWAKQIEKTLNISPAPVTAPQEH